MWKDHVYLVYIKVNCHGSWNVQLCVGTQNGGNARNMGLDWLAVWADEELCY